ncbi:MAG: hypothetical protein D6719_12655 [Candidatus Dadabacteria bacterium]|nr:MAG: hypothetical protein D6719_12655 [Candidatus Dadabacteria bacterium]
MTEYIPRRIKDTIKGVLASQCFKPVLRRYSGCGSVLMYHRIVKGYASVGEFIPYGGLTVAVERFEEQIKQVAACYRPISIEEAIFKLEKGKLHERSVVVTFDDGYRDNLTHALPVLERYRVPATIFVAPALIDRVAPLWWYEIEECLKQLARLSFDWQGKRYHWNLIEAKDKYKAADELDALFKSLDFKSQLKLMDTIRGRMLRPARTDQLLLSWEEIKELDKHPLITIAAHTVNHAVLSRETTESLYFELKQSKLRLEEELKRPVNYMAYPYGTDNEVSWREFEATRQVGYRAAFTTRSGHLQAAHRKMPWALPRITVDCYDDKKSFLWKLKGVDSFLRSPASALVVH